MTSWPPGPRPTSRWWCPSRVAWLRSATNCPPSWRATRGRSPGRSLARRTRLSTSSPAGHLGELEAAAERDAAHRDAAHRDGGRQRCGPRRWAREMSHGDKAPQRRASGRRAGEGGRAVLHPHCHPAAVVGTGAEQKVLRAAGFSVEVLDAGCCGLAGSFGFDARHEAVSHKIGEDLVASESAGLVVGPGRRRQRRCGCRPTWRCRPQLPRHRRVQLPGPARTPWSRPGGTGDDAGGAGPGQSGSRPDKPVAAEPAEVRVRRCGPEDVISLRRAVLGPI